MRSRGREGRMRARLLVMPSRPSARRQPLTRARLSFPAESGGRLFLQRSVAPWTARGVPSFPWVLPPRASLSLRFPRQRLSVPPVAVGRSVGRSVGRGSVGRSVGRSASPAFTKAASLSPAFQLRSTFLCPLPFWRMALESTNPTCCLQCRVPCGP